MSFILTNYLEQVIATVSKSTWPTSHSSRIVLLMGISSLLKFTYKAASEKFQRTMENFLSELRRRALFSIFFGWIFGTNVAYDAEATPWEASCKVIRLHQQPTGEAGIQPYQPCSGSQEWA